MTTLPDFQKDVTGEYSGNAYPETHEYRIRMVQINDGTEFVLTVETSSGDEINVVPLTEEDADGIFKVAETSHSLDVYEDDWKIPEGIERSVHWDLSDAENFIRLDADGIDEVASWLEYALGLKVWDGGEEWE